MEGRNGQIIDEDVMQTASIAPPEPREEKNGFNDRQQEQGGDSDTKEDRGQPEPIIRPSPD